MKKDQSLESYFIGDFAPRFLRGRTDNTKRLYKISIRTFGKFLERSAMLSDLTDETVDRHLDWFHAKPRSAATVNKERANLLAIWRFACRKGDLEKWPDVQQLVEPDRVPSAWSMNQINSILSCCSTLTGKIGDVAAADWWRTIHLVCWDTGERIGAVRDLQWSNVDFEGGHILVPAELRKGKRKDRLYRIAGDTLDSLKAIKGRGEMIFPWPYNRNYIWNRYTQLLKKAGLPTDRKSKFHRMRRSVASHCEAAGGNATELLGHSNRGVTLAYLDPRIVPAVHAVDLLERPNKDGG